MRRSKDRDVFEEPQFVITLIIFMELNPHKDRKFLSLFTPKNDGLYPPYRKTVSRLCAKHVIAIVLVLSDDLLTERGWKVTGSLLTIRNRQEAVVRSFSAFGMDRLHLKEEIVTRHYQLPLTDLVILTKDHDSSRETRRDGDHCPGEMPPSHSRICYLPKPKNQEQTT
ncbi:hypothetical protein CSKR_104356 [Clonorchis sinensis]|uniref:Uncharacterized protein n=1 Tax=Clonorchis sinensis TaxID=79923 RepID=A0A419QDE8_CLOSI|nr:hypothetical protein CSKR_104356 [Clonorchis sinensis]